MRLLSITLLFVSSFVFAATEFDGNWKSSCAGQQGGYSTENIKIGENKIDYTVAVFGDAGCTNKYVDLVTVGTLDIGPMSQSIAMAHDTQIIFSKINLTPRSGFVTMMLNSKTMCGYKDWKVNVAKDVSGRECDGQQMPKIGDATYDLVSLQNSKLFYGEKTEENDGTSPEKRPKKLDTSRPFSKN